jgi:hypothetical protein
MSDAPAEDEIEQPRRRDKGLPPRARSRSAGRYQVWVLIAGYGWTCAHADDSYDDAAAFADKHVARDGKVVQVEIRKQCHQGDLEVDAHVALTGE